MIDGIEARVMRRVTGRLVPFLMICYFISFIDRVNAGFAALEMNRDLGLTGAVFGLGGGLFFVSYFILEVPSNLVLERVGARRWIARIMITWGVVAGAMAFVTGPVSFYVVRLLLGAAEAGFFPGVMLYLTYWFPAEYRARIIGWFMVAVPISGLLGSPISAALLATEGWLGLHGWQWMFIVEALPAVILGFLCLPILRDKPGDARWLDDEERRWLLARLAAENERPRPVTHQSIWRVLANGQVLAMALVLAGTTATSSGLQLWQPQLIKSFGLSDMGTGLWSAVPFAVAAVAMIGWGRRSDCRGERVWHTALPLILTALSLAAPIFATGFAPMILILCLALTGIYACKGPVWAVSTEWLAASTAAAGLAQINALSNLAGFGTIYVVGIVRDATHSYPLALLPLAGLAAVSAITILFLGRQNRRVQ